MSVTTAVTTTITVPVYTTANTSNVNFGTIPLFTTQSVASVQELASISVSSHIPEFWTEMPRLWFSQFESVVLPQKQSDEVNASLIVSKLNREALQQISDLLYNPPSQNKYKTLKERLLQVYEESAEKQFKKLVSDMELGSQKPSQLLRKMIELGKNSQVSDQTLRNLWLGRLPSSIRAVLVVSQDQAAENLAKIADKIMENISMGEIAEASTSSSSGNARKADPQIFPIAEMLTQMNKLSLEVAALRGEVRQSRRNSFRGLGRGRGNWQQRPRSRSNGLRRTPEDPTWLCKYHYRYRQRANNCEKPCNWKPRQEN